MWPADPWQRIVQLKERHQRGKTYILGLVGLLGLLLFDLFFIDSAEGALFGKSVTSLLALVAFVALGSLVYTHVYEEIEIKGLMMRGSPASSRSRQHDITKEILRKASQECAKYEVLHTSPAKADFGPTPYKPLAYYDASVPNFKTYYDSPAPNFKGYYETSPPLYKPSQPILNLKPFDYSSDLADSFLRGKGLDKRMRDWVENVRKWYANDLIPLILSGHIENLLSLNRLLRDFTEQKGRWIYEGSFDDGNILNLTYEEKNNYRRVSLREIQNLAVEIGCDYQRDSDACRTQYIRGQMPAGQEAAMRRASFVEHIRQRLILEKFFEVPDFNCRGYVISRLHSLVGTSCLNGYSSSAGGFYMSDKWTPKKPTDAHILAHQFFQMLNNANTPVPDPAFNIYHDIVTKYPNSKPSFDDPKSVCFYQKNPESLIEPHFDVISGREHWIALPGNDNLFSAVALFLHHVKTKGNGFFLKMDCGDLLHLV